MTGSDPTAVVIGLDVGTTAVKAVAFGVGVGPRATASRPLTLRSGPGGREEQDAPAVATAVLDALADCVADLQGVPVAGIAISTAMHGLLGLGDDGRPLTPVATWADGRAVAQARRLADHPADLHAATGTPMHPMAPAAKLAWFREEEPELAATVHRWVDLKAWVLLGLTGRVATDRSSASGWGLLDLATGDWHPAALDAVDVAADHLPDLVDPREQLPLAAEPAARIGLPAGTPVVAGAADGPLGNIGVGAIEPGVVALSLGTSAAARAVVADPPHPHDPSLFCYGLGDGRWVAGGALSTGGLAASWAARALAPDLAGPDEPGSGPHLQRVLDLADGAPPGSGGVVMLPHLVTPRAPRWDPLREGAWLGVGRRHDRADLVRAALEGVARDLGEVVDRLDRLHPVQEVRATGGAFRSALWQSLVAAALDRPLVVTSDVGGTALGAAVLGWWALGRADDLGAARADLVTTGDGVGTGHQVRPDADLVAAARSSRAHLDDLVARLTAP